MFKEAVVQFPFQKLAVYEKGLELAAKIDELVHRCSYRDGILQMLEGLALLLPQRIAEGSGCAGDAAKAQALREARGVCYQLVPILELARRNESISEGNSESLTEEVEFLSKMIGNLVFSLENGKHARGKNEIG